MTTAATADCPCIAVWATTPAICHVLETTVHAFTIDWLPSFANSRLAVDHIVSSLASLLLVELTLPPTWLGTVRSDPATRRIPLIALGAVEVVEYNAHQFHADAILDLILFNGDLDAVMQQHQRLAPAAAVLNSQCEAALPSLVRQGLHQFDQGEYFECHETLELAWNAETGPVRDVYRAILQLAVAYLQIQRRNYAGAHKMFMRMQQWFAPLPDRCHGIDIAQLRLDAEAVRVQLEALGSDQLSHFDLTLLKPIPFAQQPS